MSAEEEERSMGLGWSRRYRGGWTTWSVLERLLAAVMLTVFSGMAAAQTATLTFAGTTKVGQASAPVGVQVSVQQTGTPSSVTALTGGVGGLDFAIADAGTCEGHGDLTQGGTCSVTVTFTPRYPGIRQGAVVVQEADGTTLASAPLSGVGLGGLPVLVPGEINTVAGNGEWVYRGDGVAATSASIFLPTGLAVDGAGNLFLSDSSNNRVRRVDAATRHISTIAGNGTAGYSGDHGAATAAELNNPSGLALDGAGNLYIADSGNNLIRRVDAVTGVITTVAGVVGGSGLNGDGSAAASATLSSPQGLALTVGGDLLIADSGNAAVRLVTFADGLIQTVAGTGTAGFNGDGTATSAQLNNPWGVAVRSDGAIAVADFSNERVRLFAIGGTMSTVAGTGARNFSGDAGPATAATLSGPAAVAFDPAGDLIIADSGNNRVRGVYGSPGVITTLAGTASEEFSGDAGPASSATLYGPYGVLFDSQGNIWISDMFHNRVREISALMLGIAYPTMKVGKISSPSPEMLYNAGNNPLTLTAPTLNQSALDPNTTTCGQSPLDPMVFCKMGIEFAPTEVGQNVAGSITWNSDAMYVSPVDDLNGQVLSVEPASIAVTADANPGLMGNPVTLTGAVSAADTGLTGTVTFSEGAQIWCNAVPLTSHATASCRIASLSLGSHTLTAKYSGDDNNAAATSQPYTEIIKQQPALALAVSSSPAVVTSNVTLTLTAADQSGTPTGQVVFLDANTTLATVALNASGVATWSTRGLGVGTHALSAQYEGDSANAAGVSNTVQEQIVQATTLTQIQSTATNVTVGTQITFSAKTVSNNGPGPTGVVQFVEQSNGTVIGTSSMDAGGGASVTVSNLPPGTHSIVATYTGDTDDAPSTSSVLTVIVQQIATVTTIGADADPANAGATVHFTAIVSMGAGGTADGALSGTVTFSDGARVLGTAPINATGQVTFAATGLTVGQHAIVASFGGNTNYAASNSVPLNEVVAQTATQTSLSSGSSTTLVGEPASFTVVVTSGTGVPTGTVTFRDGSTALGTTTLDPRGTATFSTARLSQGPHNIMAVYGGDANYDGSTSAAVQENVELAQPALSLRGPTAVVDAGTTVQFVASLASSGMSPTGALMLMDGAARIGMTTVTSAGSFTFSTNTLSIGTHSLLVSYGGDQSNAAATSATITVVVRQAPSSTALSMGPNPVIQGDQLTMTATISSDSPNPAGTVTFFDGNSALGSASLSAGGVAILKSSALTRGQHSITAVYSGDTNHAGSTSVVVQELVVQASSLGFSSNSNPASAGQNVTFAAQVNEGGATPATGTVEFRDNGTLLAAVPVNGSGAASFSTTTLTVGTHTISATYSGDQNYATSNAQLVQTIVSATTQVSLSADANPATYGQPVRLNVVVSSNGAVPTGQVQFTDGGAVIGSATLNPHGVAVLTTAMLRPGSHSIVANYAGDTRATPSVSTPLPLAVKQVTGLVLTSSANPTQTLSPITLTARVSGDGAELATGSVVFSDGNAVLGTAALDGTGSAVLSVPSMSAGAHSISAVYAGDGADFGANAPALNETVEKRSTAVTVTGSSTDQANPQQVTLIAVVKGGGSVAATGTVTFTTGNLTLGVAPVDGTGVATITVLFEQTTEGIVAEYAGDAAYAGSQSASTSITAGQAPQFTLALNVPSMTIATGQHTTVTVNVGSVKGFSDTIVLGCLGLPYAATCTFDQSQVKLAPDGTVTASVIIDTGNPLGAGSGTTASVRQGPSGTLLCCVPVGVLLSVLRRRKNGTLRQRLGSALVITALLLLSLGPVGCGGLTTQSTPPGSYTFKVVGRAQGSGATEAQTITLVVTQ